MSKRNYSKRYPSISADERLEDTQFALDITNHLYNDTPVEDIYARVRELVFRYGYDVNNYPDAIRHAFWSLVTNDTWGEFRRKLRQFNAGNLQELDPSDKTVVYSHM